MTAYRIVVVTPHGERTYSCGAGEYILDKALENGIDLPYLCRQGWCITCAARILEGEVDQSEALRYYPEDAEAGFVLTCSAYPRGDLKLETHQKEAMRAHRIAHGLPVPGG